ncbi:UPF0573 protein C2orf70-like protein [Camelus dromedarius]|uniref:Ciliary microtubule inner protein 2C n=1 Tax=Camelus dromedarius TaxID=9838 RepID=A0A5N4D7I3_CAMDR|nr:UPF0573 protein C2orf70-like protein [Camelus dromedarius]
MASRSAGTLLTEFNAAYVPPGLMPGYQGHVPGVAFSFGSPYGTTTLKYFQDQRNAALEKSHTPFSNGGHFPTIFSPNPDLVQSHRSHTWNRWLHMPSYTRFNLDSTRSAELTRFYQLQMAQRHREYYQDKTGMVPRVPYFVLPVREWERYPIPTDLFTAIVAIITTIIIPTTINTVITISIIPATTTTISITITTITISSIFLIMFTECLHLIQPPLSPKKKWYLLRASPENLKTYQTFPSGKRVSPQERQRRDRYFEFRA